MTPKQRAALDAISDLTRRGVAPTYREIAAHIGKSLGPTYEVVQALVEGGYVTHDRTGKHRSLRVVGQFSDEALSRLSRPDLMALRAAVDRRLAA